MLYIPDNRKQQTQSQIISKLLNMAGQKSMLAWNEHAVLGYQRFYIPQRKLNPCYSHLLGFNFRTSIAAQNWIILGVSVSFDKLLSSCFGSLFGEYYSSVL